MDADLAFAGALEQRRLMLAKAVSPCELAEWYLERIERIDAPLHSYLTVTPERAMHAARAAEEAVMRGDTLGLRVSSVSLIDTACNLSVGRSRREAMLGDARCAMVIASMQRGAADQAPANGSSRCGGT